MPNSVAMDPMAKNEIRFFGTEREFAADRQTYLDLADEVLRSGQTLQSPHVSGFERGLCALTGRKHAIAVGSATDALYFALCVAGVRPGDEVLVTDFSFVASASCIVRAGAVPVFLDVDESFNVDLGLAAGRITPRTRAIVYVHLFGQMGPPAAIEAFAKAHGLVLIEDAAQAIGASHAGRPAGSLGLASCISFDPTKPLSAPGSGGALLTDDDAAAARVRRLRYHGKEGGAFVENGFNSQMPSLAAAFLGFKLTREPLWRAARRRVAAAYCDGLSNARCVLPAPPPEAEHIFHKFVLRVPDRDRARAAIEASGVRTMVHYERTLSAQPSLARYAPARANETASRMTGEVLSLPIHPFLTDDEIDRVIEAVKGALRG